MTKYERFRKQFAIEEFEKLKVEIEADYIYQMPRLKLLNRKSVLDIIDKHISELKGENNE